MDRTPEAPRLRVVRNLWNDLCVFSLVGVGGEFYSDGLCGARRLLPVQVFNGLLCLWSLVEANESHTTRKPCWATQNISMHAAIQSKPHASLNLLTCSLIDENAGVDNSAVSRKHVFDILLRHCFRQSADVEVGILYSVGARPGIRHLTEQKLWND